MASVKSYTACVQEHARVGGERVVLLLLVVVLLLLPMSPEAKQARKSWTMHPAHLLRSPDAFRGCIQGVTQAMPIANLKTLPPATSSFDPCSSKCSIETSWRKPTHSTSTAHSIHPILVTAMASSLTDKYKKWDNLELSDDEDDVHPNIDKQSWFRWKHQARVDR